MARQSQTTSSGSDETRYVVDFELIRRLGRSPEYMLFQRRCASCQGKHSEGKELPTIKAQLREFVRCCSAKEGYIRAEMPLREVAFLTLLSRGNEAMGLRDLYRIVAEEWATHLNPKNVTLEDFRHILDSDRYYGLRVVAKP